MTLKKGNQGRVRGRFVKGHKLGGRRPGSTGRVAGELRSLVGEFAIETFPQVAKAVRADLSEGKADSWIAMAKLVLPKAVEIDTGGPDLRETMVKLLSGEEVEAILAEEASYLPEADRALLTGGEKDKA